MMAVPDLRIDEICSVGEDRGAGNLLGIQPCMELRDYATEDRFRAKIAGYLEAARGRGWVGLKSVVVLPEYIGTWLVAAGAGPAVFAADTIERAMLRLALQRPGAFARELVRAQARDRVKAALFRLNAREMAAIYQRVFAGLAREFGATIVAGSILLPEPRVVNGALVAGGGPLFNAALVFRPDGSLYDQVVRKRFPIGAELPFVACAAPGPPPVFDTPAGRLTVLICADAFYPQSYATLKDRGVRMLAVPSYLEPAGVWGRQWGGYDGAQPPEDVDLRDVGAISEREAWLKYGMAGRIAAVGIPYGANVFLRGTILDLGSDGATVLAHDGATVETRYVQGAALANVWLG